MLNEVAAAYLQLRKTISSIGDDTLIKPHTAGIWSGKDVISHLADWEGIYAQVLRDRRDGKRESWPTSGPNGVSLDAWNEAQVIARADWSLGEVMEYLEAPHDDLMELLESLPELDPVEVLHYTRDHYAMHYDDLAAARAAS